MALVAMCKGFKVAAIGCIKFSCYEQWFSTNSLIFNAARKGSLRSSCMWLLFPRVLKLPLYIHVEDFQWRIVGNTGVTYVFKNKF